MFKNNLKTVFRSLLKQKVLSLINILGLAVGLAVVILILLFVKHELSYDRFHENADNLYRVYTNVLNEDRTLNRRMNRVSGPIGPALEEYFPEIKSSVRVKDFPAMVKMKDDLYSESVTVVDKSFFQVFSFPLIMGNPDVVFAQPNSLVITENQAQKYFGNVDPIGKTITILWGGAPFDFIISGVAASVPINSSIDFKMVIDIETAKTNKFYAHFDNWVNFSVPTYVLVENKEKMDSLSARLPSFTESNERFFDRLKKYKITPFFALQEISKVHLDQDVSGSPDLNTIYILSLIALIILVIGCINFINLSVSRASLRSLEVGMRKVVGAERKDLIYQFWGEYIAVTAISMGMGIVFASLLLPFFNRVAEIHLNISEVFQPVNILMLLFITFAVGILSGSYPALLMSAFRTVDIIKGKLMIRGKNLIGRVLVVVQFALSIFLIVSTSVLERQINYMITRDAGLDKEGIVAVATGVWDPGESGDIMKFFRQRTSQSLTISSISGITPYFGNFATFSIRKDGDEIDVFQNRVDYDLFKTLNIKVVQGRTFSRDYPSDVNGLVVNEAFIKTFDIKDPIGKPFKDYENREMIIIGVVKDYNFQDCRSSIKPALFHILPDWPTRFILARVIPGNIPAALAELGGIWKENQPNKPFTYYFVDETFRDMYLKETRWGAILGYSSIIAVLISCMGIFGLTAISITRRTKEIGIRKVLGASVAQVGGLILKDFMWLVVISNIIAWPVAYFTMKSVLINYFYRIPLGLQYFIFAGLLSLVIAAVTIIFLAVKAALANPVDSIKYE